MHTSKTVWQRNEFEIYRRQQGQSCSMQRVDGRKQYLLVCGHMHYDMPTTLTHKLPVAPNNMEDEHLTKSLWNHWYDQTLRTSTHLDARFMYWRIILPLVKRFRNGCLERDLGFTLGFQPTTHETSHWCSTQLLVLYRHNTTCDSTTYSRRLEIHETTPLT